MSDTWYRLLLGVFQVNFQELPRSLVLVSMMIVMMMMAIFMMVMLKRVEPLVEVRPGDGDEGLLEVLPAGGEDVEVEGSAGEAVTVGRQPQRLAEAHGEGGRVPREEEEDEEVGGGRAHPLQGEPWSAGGVMQRVHVPGRLSPVSPSPPLTLRHASIQTPHLTLTLLLYLPSHLPTRAIFVIQTIM